MIFALRCVLDLYMFSYTIFKRSEMKAMTKVFLALFLGFSVYAQQKIDTLNVPFDSLMDYRVCIDGYIDTEDNEYPASFRDPTTGITVYWGHDDSVIYVGMEVKGKGWMAIGLGSPVMEGSNMIIGYYSDESSMVVNHIGAAKMHRSVSDSLLEDWEVDYDDETNTTVMEFLYPLRWPKLRGTAISGLFPGKTYDLILARNPKTTSLSAKHTQKSRRVFIIEPNPISLQPESESEKSESEKQDK